MKVTIEYPYTISLICPICGKVHFVEVAMEDYMAWEVGGKLAQEAFPYLSATEREQLISQLCPKCQESIFGPEEA